MSSRPRYLSFRFILGPALLVALVLAAPLAAPNLFIVRLFVDVGIAILLATGVNLVFGYAGQVSLGHAAFYGLGAYTSAILAVRSGWPPAFGMVAAALGTAAVAYLIGLPALRLKGHYLAMATLGFNEIVAIVLTEAKPLTGGPDGLRGIPHLAVAGYEFGSHIANYYLVWAFVLVGLLVARNLVRSRVGRALRALHDSEVAAAASGVNVARYKTHIFVISAVYAGLAGALSAHFNTFISPPTFSVATSVTLLAMVVIGGMGTLVGPAIGAVALTVGPEYLRAYQDYTIVVYGALLMAAMAFFPGGIASMFSKTPRGRA